MPKKSGARAGLHATSSATRSASRCASNPRVTVLTAAMCQGNKLERIRDEFPDRFFDTGICESHAVAFAAGQAKAGLRPIVDIYSTFLQRSYDQIFQEVALQNLPVVFTLDRAGLTGPDGPTHHGVFDIAYMRVLPEHGRHGPRRRLGRRRRCSTSPCGTTAPSRSAIPRPTPRRRRTRRAQPIELGRAEVLRWGRDGAILCLRHAARRLPQGGRPAARPKGWTSASSTPASPSRSTAKIVERAVRECGFVVTVEEGCLMGGFGSAVLEAASDAGPRHQPHQAPGHSRPLHRARRARRAARRPRPRRRRHRRRLPRAGRARRRRRPVGNALCGVPCRSHATRAKN